MTAIYIGVNILVNLHKTVDSGRLLTIFIGDRHQNVEFLTFKM